MLSKFKNLKGSRKLEILLCATVSPARHQPWLEKSCTLYSRFGNMLKIHKRFIESALSAVNLLANRI